MFVDLRSYDPNQPRDPAGTSTGGQWTSSGAGGAVLGPDDGSYSGTEPGIVSLERTDDKAFNGRQVEVETKLSKQEAGMLGEEVVLAYLRDVKGYEDARPLNLEKQNFPVDLVRDHELIEVKTGLVSNGRDAQKWRATIGQPGPKERAWLKTASADDKRAWNAAKSRAIIERKNGILEAFTATHGVPAKGATITTIINPDTGIADIYRFDGFHTSIRWNSDTAREGYVGSYRYERP